MMAHSAIKNFCMMTFQLLLGLKRPNRPAPLNNAFAMDIAKIQESEQKLMLWRQDCAAHDRWKLPRGHAVKAMHRWQHTGAPKSMIDPNSPPWSNIKSFYMSNWIAFLPFFGFLFTDLFPNESRAEFNCINAVFQDFVLLCRCLFLPPCYLYILICRYGIKRRTIAQHKADAWNHLRDCERLLPRNCMTTALHALAHAWDDVANFGPWYVFWTLPLERYMKFMRANIFSGTYPAANFITRAKRIQRLAYLSPRIRRSLRKQFAATGYQPSEALAGALGQRRRKIGWLGVRDFSEIKSFGTFDLPLLCSKVYT